MESIIGILHQIGHSWFVYNHTSAHKVVNGTVGFLAPVVALLFAWRALQARRQGLIYAPRHWYSQSLLMLSVGTFLLLENFGNETMRFFAVLPDLVIITTATLNRATWNKAYREIREYQAAQRAKAAFPAGAWPPAPAIEADSSLR